MDDSQIIQLYFQHSEEALSQTAAKYGNYCFSIARNILASQEDAKEVVNDTYMAAWNAIPPHKPVSFPAFLGKITRRISINRYLALRTAKRSNGEAELALEELSACTPSPSDIEAELEAGELSRILNRFVRGLPETERQIFVLRYWYVESIREIAVRFGFSQSKVKSMLHRSRCKLKQTLTQEGIFV